MAFHKHLPSSNQHDFARIPKAEIQRSAFDRSHTYKTTFNSGYLIPFYLDEVLPGDTFNLDANIFARLTTQVVPVMDNLYLDTFFFFVPNRLIWSHWEQFNGAQNSPGDSTDYVVPQVEVGLDGFSEQTLLDYLGVPPCADIKVNALPVRAYHKIYDDWFRDENLIDSYFKTAAQIGDGPDDVAEVNILHRRCKRADYFTTCLPWPQKGPGVELPLGGTAPVKGTGMAIGLTDGTRDFSLLTGASSSDPRVNPYWGDGYGDGVGDDGGLKDLRDTGGHNVGVTTDSSKSGLITDLSTATAATINSLRQAFALQRLYERDARGGTRYIEILKAHFGVTSPDARLQRSEYLGGSSHMVQAQAVASTANTGASLGNIGELASYAYATGRSGFTKSFVEHGYVIGLVEVRADLSYQDGLNRLWSRSTRFDFYWPALSHLGEQAVLNKEIWLQGDSNVDEKDNVINELPFGYQERYAEYRYHPSMITGQLRSSSPQTLDYWHYAQAFSDLPVLGQTFIEDNPPIARSLAVDDVPEFVFDSYIKCKCVRPMPVYSVPGLIDHF